MADGIHITNDDIEKGFCQIDGGPVYECFYLKQRQYWNGWAVPIGLTAKSLCDFIEESMRSYNPAKNPDDAEWCAELLSSIRPHHYGELTIYEVGDGLIWDEVTKQEVDPAEYRGADYGND